MKKNNKAIQVAGYTRLAGLKGGDNLSGRQVLAIKRFCSEKNYSLCEVFEEGSNESGNGLLPAFFSMLKTMFMKNIGIVVVESLESLSSDEKTRECLLVFLLSKGIQVEICGKLREEKAVKNSILPGMMWVSIQREFTKFDRNIENVKLLKAREEIRKRFGKCEGRKSYSEAAPETIKEIRRLRRNRMGRKRRSCLEIARTLNNTGYLTLSGKKFTGNNVSVILHRLRAV